MRDTKKKGLGDQVEEIIQKTMPKVAKKYKNCLGCKARKKYLNKNYNAIFG